MNEKRDVEEIPKTKSRPVVVSGPEVDVRSQEEKRSQDETPASVWKYPASKGGATRCLENQS